MKETVKEEKRVCLKENQNAKRRRPKARRERLKDNYKNERINERYKKSGQDVRNLLNRTARCGCKERERKKRVEIRTLLYYLGTKRNGE